MKHFRGLRHLSTHYEKLVAGAEPGRRDRTSPKREVNFDPARWSLHRSPWRHLRHVATIPSSSVLQRLAFPDLTLVFLSSSFVTFYNHVEHIDITLPPLPFTLCSLALGLLATFRTNTSYNRFWEARGAWGQVINSSRDFARQTAIWVDKDDPARQRLARLLKSFPVALNFHLTINGGHHLIRCSDPRVEELCKAELAAELGDIYPDAQDPDFRAIMANHSTTGGNMPLLILQIMGTCIRKVVPSDLLAVEMDSQLTKLCGALGACEKILKTPIPTKFSRHTSRFVTLWCNLLPLALWPFTGYATVPAAVFVTWALLGIEDIGVQLEDPFDVLPLRQYSTAVQNSINQILGPGTK
jgi:ion channel-forming bestrophin family protein